MSTHIQLQWNRNTDDTIKYEIFRKGSAGVTIDSTLVDSPVNPEFGTIVSYDDVSARDTAKPDAPGWQTTPIVNGGNSANVQFAKPQDNGTPWYYRIRAFDEVGNYSGLSEEVSDTVLGGIPDGLGSGTFEIYRSKTSSFTPDTSGFSNRVSVIDCPTGVAAGGSVSYSDSGATDNASPDAAGTPTVADGQDSASTGDASNWAEIAWTEPDDNGTNYYYKIRARDAESNWSEFGTEKGVLVVSGLRATGTYEILRATDSSVIATLDKDTTNYKHYGIDTTPPPTTATNLTGVASGDGINTGTGHIDLSWTNPANGGATKSPDYKIRTYDAASNTSLTSTLSGVNVDSGYYGCKVLWKAGSTYPANVNDTTVDGSKELSNSATSYTIPGLTSEVQYSVVIFFRDRQGNWSSLDKTNAAIQLTIPDTIAPAVPTGLTATAV